jgi:rRNA-processing protein FCF1
LQPLARLQLGYTTYVAREAKLIIFDTNAFNLVSPDSVKADIIHKIRKSGHQRVAVPWMVLEELAAHN